MMSIFNRIFKRNEYKEINEEVKKYQESRDDSVNKYQVINAKRVINSTIIQNIVENSNSSAVIDKIIDEELELVLQGRFFNEINNSETSLTLANRIVDGELFNGSDIVKCRTLAWCSRLLSIEELIKAEEYLKLAKQYGSCIEVAIAEAFILSKKGDKDRALNILSKLNSNISNSASIMILANHGGALMAIEWLDKVKIKVADLDSDGKYFLMILYLQLEKWELAESCLEALNDEDFCKTPVLNYTVAIVNLIRAVPHEFRPSVINQVPIEAAKFPLAADEQSIAARKLAHKYFITTLSIALKFNCFDMARMLDEYVIWLELRDPNGSEYGKKNLEEKLRDSRSSLHLVRFALEFGIKLDLKVVEEEIERQIALYGGITREIANARFVLAFTKGEPDEIANYIERYRSEFSTYFNEKHLRFLQIEMFAKSGKTQKAKECLETLLQNGISEDEENRLRIIISESKIGERSTVEIRKEQYKKTGLLSDLLILIDELSIKHEWNELSQYSEILFEKTHALDVAEIFSESLSNTHNHKRLVEFLKINSILLDQSRKLQILYCWSLYYEGDLLEARFEMSKLNDISNNPDYLALQINLGIAIGDWNTLSVFIANESLNIHVRSAEELIRDAQLALQLGSLNAKELTYAAAEKGKEDPRILASAYFIATNAGWESDATVYQWLNKAAELSGKDGPIQKISINDMLNYRPNWEQHEMEIYSKLNRGEIPMYIAAEFLNKTLIHMMLFSAYTNLAGNDVRRKSMVYAYSGCRQASQLKIGGAIAIDVSALLTLSFLNLLDVGLNAFSIVYIPHSTLTWLFEEKRKVAFHQPSRFKVAHEIQNLLATGVIEKFKANSVSDSGLAAQIGDELALLIAEAEKTNGNDAKGIVVCSYPVYQIASFMEEEVDLTMYYGMLSSCQAIVEKLRMKGRITVDEFKKAHAYFQLHEKPWPNQPEILDGAILYLDELAITHFLKLGILEKLKNAGFRLIASPKQVSMANELISYESMSGKINKAIECIRVTINYGIDSGKIKIGRKINFIEAKDQKQSISNHPTSELFSLINDCEAVLVDDRSINEHTYIDNGNRKKMIFSTLDLLDALVNNNHISDEERLGYRTMLRKAGYCFMPVSNEELSYNLKASTVNDNKFIENAELKAIRENILHVRMSNSLKLPKEAMWLDKLRKTFIEILYELWGNDEELFKLRIYSNWIMNLIDIRGWSHCLEELGDNTISNSIECYILLLLSYSENVSIKNRNEYFKWLDDIISNIFEENPIIYSSIVEQYRKIFIDIVSKEFKLEVKK